MSLNNYFAVVLLFFLRSLHESLTREDDYIKLVNLQHIRIYLPVGSEVRVREEAQFSAIGGCTTTEHHA